METDNVLQQQVNIRQEPLARTFDAKGAAKTWAADVEKEMQMGRYQDARLAEKLMFAEVLNRYLDQVSSTKRPNSERRDRDSVQAILNGFGLQIFLPAINTQRLAHSTSYNFG